MKLNYKQYGEQGPVLIILHGLLGSLDNWQTLAMRWGDSMRVYALDQRNHGRSPHSDAFSYTEMVGDLHGFCIDHGLDAVNLLGHSMGGKTAMHFALEHPSLTEKLLVADIAPVAYRGGHEPIFDAMTALPINQVKSRSDAEEWLAGHIAERSIRQFLLKNMERKADGSGYGWKINLDAISAGYDDILGFDSGGLTYSGPVLFLRGDRSGYVDESRLEEYRRIFPAAFIRNIPQAGHWLHAEQPDLVYEYVRTFVELGRASRLA